MDNSAAWAVAFAFVGVSVAIAVANIFTPATPSAQIECIKARGHWVTDWGLGICEFKEGH